MMADNLKMILRREKVTRRTVAHNVGISKAALDQKLDAGVGFSEKEIIAIKKFLNVSYEELLNETA